MKDKLPLHTLTAKRLEELTKPLTAKELVKRLAEQRRKVAKDANGK